jgi:hypothetical protein
MEISIFCQMWCDISVRDKRLVSEINKIIKYNEFSTTTKNIRNIACPPKITRGKDTVGGGLEHQRA